MNGDCLKLTTYHGERERAVGGLLADALVDVYARHRLRTSVALRGSMGFGLKHTLHTDRVLTLSEDLPMVSVAVDGREPVEAALAEIRQWSFDGLVTVERASMLTDWVEPPDVPRAPDAAVKLTAFVGRGERIGARPAHEAIVEILHRRGVAGATVLLGVDGTVGGERRRGRFFALNAAVPLMIVAVGSGDQLAAALADLTALEDRPIVTLERVRVCKRDGALIRGPHEVPPGDDSGPAVWQKLMVHAPEQARHRGRPLAEQVVRRLREAGAAGATALRGVWGYSGDHRPHGDSFWQLQRRVPTVTVIVDTPERVRDWFAIVDELTSEAGLVTSEIVPALQATSARLRRGALESTDLHPRR